MFVSLLMLAVACVAQDSLGADAESAKHKTMKYYGGYNYYNSNNEVTWSGMAWGYDSQGNYIWMNVSECPGGCAIN